MSRTALRSAFSMWRLVAAIVISLAWLAPATAAAEADAQVQPVETITVPLPPPGVFREPDWKRDFDGYRAIAHGWLSDDGKTFWCIADRGEPISFQSIREGKAKRDPVFLALDLTTRTIVREVELPDDGPWVTGQHITYLPKVDRLLGWKVVSESVHRDTPRGDYVVRAVTGQALHTLDLHDPQQPVTRAYPYSQWRTDSSGWEWVFSADGQWVWRLVYQSEETRPVLEKMSTATLETVQEDELDWTPQIRNTPGDPFDRLAWRIDETTSELWIGALVGEGETGALHWLRFNLNDGSSIGRVVVSDEVAPSRSVSFLGDGKYLAARMPMPEDDYRLGTQRLWRLPMCELAIEMPTTKAGSFGIWPLLGDGRYLFVKGSVSRFVSGSVEPIHEPVVWRYDRERDVWSWPRRIAPYVKDHELYTDDGRTLVAFNEAHGRPNRLVVYRFADDDRYDAELAQRMSDQLPRPAPPGPLPEAEHTVKVSPEGDELAVDRRALPVPEGKVLQADASADGKRVALWMVRPSLIPKDRAWHTQPVDPARQVYQAVVIDAETGKPLLYVQPPEGYMDSELSRHTRATLSGDGRWLVVYFAHDNKLMPGMDWPLPGAALMRVIDVDTAENVAERSLPESGPWWLKQVGDGERILLRGSNLGRPTVSTFEFCKLPSLEAEASMRWTWPDREYGDEEQRAIADNVMYDPEKGRFVALMREPGERRGGRQVQTDQWVQYFDAQTMRPIKRGPVTYAQHGARYAGPGNGLIVVNYEHDGRSDTVDVYRYDSDRPTLRIDVTAYEHGANGEPIIGSPWIALQPSSQMNGKPGIMLVNAETRQVLGPLSITGTRSILWIATDGKRILTQKDSVLGFGPYGNQDTASPLEWLTVRK